MATDSGQRFIRRNRPPRVHITYEDPYNAERRIELPFVMGVLSDLSGNNSNVEKPDVAERKFLEFDMDNFESRMAAIEPGAAFTVANKLGDGAGERLSVDMHFRKMDDFSPAAVARQVPALAPPCLLSWPLVTPCVSDCRQVELPPAPRLQARDCSARPSAAGPSAAA